MADKFLDKTGLAYFWEKIKAYFQSQHTTPPEYTIVRLADEEVGYAASYVLKKDGTQVGATINIPKDYLVRSGEVKTVTVADEPYEGAVVGDKYLDFVVNTVDDSGNTSHIYIPVSDLVDAYIAGNGIQISDNNYISVKVSQQGVDHGLGVGGDGLTVRMVTPSINGVGGTHGAMYAADKEKLDNLHIVGVFTSDSDTDPVIEGVDGLVPAPTWAERSKFLRGDGTWDNPSSNCKTLQTAVGDPTASGTSIEFVSNITQNENGEISPSKKTVRTMVASGQNHASGLVPDPGSTAGTTRYLCENGTWSEPNGGGGGSSTPTDVQVNGTSITSNNVANIQTEGVYDPTTNKIATMSDLPNVPTVNDSTITIKRNGSDNGDSFTTNTANNKTINLGLSDVATSGSYNDLEDVPAIPAAQIQSDWSQTNASSLDFIQNKPIIPTVGTLNTDNETAQAVNSSESFGGSINLHKVSKTGNYNDLIGKPTIPNSTSDLTNDSGFITSADIPSPADTSPLMDGTAAVGLSVDYAREDHVHPTDTSRAADNAVVHKTGNESISGEKTFNDGIFLNNSTFTFLDGQDSGVYIEEGEDSSGTKKLLFSDVEDDSSVRLGNVALPTQNSDAANKAYVDGLLNDNNAVYLNGCSFSSGIQPWSLCAFSLSIGGTVMYMTSFTGTGGNGGGAPLTGVQFPIGCKIYYHPSDTAVSANTEFTSKKFHTTFKEVDGRYSSVTGSSLNLNSQNTGSTSTIYLHVLIDGGYWKPYYKSGDTNEIIVSSNQLQPDNFYIYLGKKVGADAYKFQLEDNNPLYYYDGSDLIDWASYKAKNTISAASGSGLSISDGVVSYTPVNAKFDLDEQQTISIGSTGIFEHQKTFSSSTNIPVGQYKVTVMRHVWYDGSSISSDFDVNVVLRFKRSGSNSWTYITGGTYVMRMITSPNDGQSRMGSLVVYLTGFITLSTETETNDVVSLVVEAQEGVVLGGEQPITGNNIEAVTDMDFILFEKL